MKISPARTAAFDVLLRIFRDGGYSSILLPAAEIELGDNDRTLCHELVLGVLRHRLQLERAIDGFSGGKPLDLEVRIAAELGLYQLHFLQRIPAYSAVNESVALVQRAKKSSAKGFVNALLRRAKVRETEAYENEIERLAVQTSHPHWLVEKWIEDFGAEEAEALLRSNNQRSPTTFRITAKGQREGVLPQGDWELSDFVDGCYKVEKLSRELRHLSEEGLIYFQDEGSQLVGSLVKLESGGRFLDVCAAPGSKTTMIAARSASDTSLVAGDLFQSRVRVLQRNCQLQGTSHVRIVRYDAEGLLPFADGQFDSVLVDAPCSGSGTIRNNPEIRYFLKPSDLAELHHKQLAILDNASKTVKAGGRLIYSTCSLEPEENEQVIADFMAEHPDFAVTRPIIASELGSLDDFLRTTPSRHDMDGFFAATLVRRH